MLPLPMPSTPPDHGPPLAGGTVWHVHDANDPDRDAVQAFIARVFARRFGARVQQFAPQLVSLRERDSGRIVAAAGYRPASQGPLFLEHYLDAPIEHLLAQQAGETVSRQGIVEVGQLAAERAGEGRRLILLLGQHLAAQPVEWVTSTLTQELRQLFVRLGVTPLALGHAHPLALGPQAQAWGSYYDHHPVVLAGRLQAALRLIRQRSTPSITPSLP